MPTFPVNLQSPVTGGPVFDTGIVTTDQGREQRNCNWWDPVYKWSVKLLLDSTDLPTVTDFFDARLGRAGDFDFIRPFVAAAGETTTVTARFDQDDLKYDAEVSPVVTCKIREIVSPGALGGMPTYETFPADSSEELLLVNATEEREASFATLVIGEEAVIEVRQETRARVRRWVVSYDALTLDQILDLQDFFIARRGQAQTFLLRLSESETVRVRFESDRFEATYYPAGGVVGKLPMVEVLDFDLTDTVGDSVRDYLRNHLTTICAVYRIEASDGTMVGFTTGSRNLTLGFLSSGGESYDAQPIDPSETQDRIGLAPNNLEVVAVYNDTLSRESFVRGKWDRAEITIQFVDYLTGLVIDRNVYSLGDIQCGRKSWSADLRSLSWRLASQEIGDRLSPLCRVRRFGNAECGVNLATHTFSATVAEVISDTRFRLTMSGTFTAGQFRKGELTFTAGLNGSTGHEVKDSTASPDVEVELQLPPAFPVSVGDPLTLITGCDRTFDRCQFFDNARRFRGEPHIVTLVQLNKIQRA